MQIPVEVLLSACGSGGFFESTGSHSGIWWRNGKKVAEWHRVGTRAVVAWLNRSV